MRKIAALILTLVLCITCTLPAFAAQVSVNAGKTKTVGDHAYIDTEGNLWMWGNNNVGQCGINQAEHSAIDTPTKVMSHVVAFDRGNVATIILKDDGSVWTMGHDFSYQRLSKATDSYVKFVASYEPVKMLDGCVAVGMAGGTPVFAALKANGDLYTWGDNYLTINAHVNNDPSIPLDCYYNGLIGQKTGELVKPVKTASNVKYFTLHSKGVCSYVTFSGEVYFWGWSNWLGNETTVGWQGINKSFTNSKIAEIHITRTNPKILTTDGDVYSWGSGSNLKPSSMKKTMSGVKQLIANDQTYNSNDSGHDSYEYDPYVIKSDNGLYDPTGTKLIMSNVCDACLYDSNLGLFKDLRGYILKNDGTLYEASASNPTGVIDTFTKIASNVALSGQPFSSLKANADTVCGFKDVHSTDYYAEPIKWAVSNGITSGTTATTFSPGNTCTKGQVLTILWRANGSPSSSGRNPFSKVEDGKYYTTACEWAYEEGIVDELDMDPDSVCTRGYAMLYIYRSHGAPSISYTYAWTDVTIHFRSAVSWGYCNGVTTAQSNPDGWTLDFGTNSGCTRGQIITFLYRARNL